MIKQKLSVLVVVLAGLLGSYLALGLLSTKNSNNTVAAEEPASGAGESNTKSNESDEYSEFKGKIAKRYEDSVEWWAPKKRPPTGAPNVIIFLLDDTGFGQIGSFGGLVNTPNIDKLAANGLRYNNFHTTALCSPSRATLMAGRNPHTIGLGSHRHGLSWL